MELVNTLNFISNKQPTFDEEDSFHILKDLQIYDKWICYSSKDYPLKNVEELANTFCFAHGMVSLSKDPQKIEDPANYFWSSVPLGVFRYKMLDDGSWDNVTIFSKKKGYTVEGLYWLNGFCYLVKNDTFLLEVNLFIDKHTKDRYSYPDLQA
jgi:hypothetical protein